MANDEKTISKSETKSLLENLKKIKSMSQLECDKGCLKQIDPDQIIELDEKSNKYKLPYLSKKPLSLLVIQDNKSTNTFKLKIVYSYKGSCADAVWGRNPYSGSYGYMGCRRYSYIKEEKVLDVELPSSAEKKAYLIELKTNGKDEYITTVKNLNGDSVPTSTKKPFLGIGNTILTIQE